MHSPQHLRYQTYSCTSRSHAQTLTLGCAALLERQVTGSPASTAAAPASMARHRHVHMCALCGSDTGEWNGRLKKCSACRRVTYCSRRCGLAGLLLPCTAVHSGFIHWGPGSTQPLRLVGPAKPGALCCWRIDFVHVACADASELTGLRTGQPASRSRCTCGGATSAAAAPRSCRPGR